ncbi:MAG: Hpt domain-containing protein [Holophagales bacterium]|nr:Hpt domain-containing protein [Holophagales bacterium]
MDSAGTQEPRELPPRLDRETVDTLVRLGKKRGNDLLGQLLEIFERQGPQDIAALRQALEQGDVRSFERAAHSLKGSYHSLGALRLAHLALQLEHCAQASELAKCGAIVDLLEQEFEHTASELRAFPRG